MLRLRIDNITCMLVFVSRVISKYNMCDKRKRCNNFTSTEVDILMKIILQELNIIENKQTDGATLREKNQAWQRVTTLFNRLNNNNRDITSLKSKYENIKRSLKKKITENKVYKKETGGGPPQNIELLWFEEQLYSTLKISIEGLKNVGDSDIILETDLQQLPIIFESVSDQNTILLEPAESEQTPTSQNVTEPLDKVVIINENVIDQIPSTSKLAKNYTTSNKNWNFKRRKLTVTAEEKQQNIQEFVKLNETKREVADIQKLCYSEELNIKHEELEQKKREWLKRKEIMDVELKIKQEELKETLEQNTRKRKMCDLLEEEQKLKIEILKCELNYKLTQLH